jgi:hypothetical protein
MNLFRNVTSASGASAGECCEEIASDRVSTFTSQLAALAMTYR